jgi:hypothetical protein
MRAGLGRPSRNLRTFVTLLTQNRCVAANPLKADAVSAEAIAMEASVTRIARWRMAPPQDVFEPLHASTALTRARVLTMTDRCWSCSLKVRGVVGVLVEMSAGHRFVPFSEIADELASVADPRVLAARGIGPLRHRDSPGIVGGYVSNGCLQCDALIGRINLDDMLDEHIRNGGTYAQLDSGLALELQIPAAGSFLRRSA